MNFSNNVIDISQLLQDRMFYNELSVRKQNHAITLMVRWERMKKINKELARLNRSLKLRKTIKGA